jgi:hypothetical protein
MLLLKKRIIQLTDPVLGINLSIVYETVGCILSQWTTSTGLVTRDSLAVAGTFEI